MKFSKKKHICLSVIAVISMMICIMGCTDKNITDKPNIVQPAAETPGAEVFRQAEFGDMFGFVTTKNSENLNAVAVFVGDEMYVYTDYCEYQYGTEYIYTADSGKSVTIKLEEEQEESGVLNAGLSVLTASSADMDLPYAEEVSQQTMELRYFAEDGQREISVNMPNSYENTSIEELISGYADIKYPAALIADGKCAGIVSGNKIVYIPENTGKKNIVSEINLPQITGETDQPETGEETGGESNKPWENNKRLFIAAGIILLFAVILLAFYFIRKKLISQDIPHDTSDSMVSSYGYKNTSGTVIDKTSEFSVGKVHNIGKRSNQQDSMGMTNLECGFFAAVADGMGGLADGDKISQKIIMTMLEACEKIKKMTSDNSLFGVTRTVNNAVNAMTGNNRGHVISGSTLVAVFISSGYFHWVSVGDSRIYLYRAGSIIQLNREHNYESDLILDAVNGAVPFSEVKTHPKRHGLTSFIGMGELKHIDGSLRPIKLCRGDRLLLMSDGVYNALTEEEMTHILSSYAHSGEAASVFEESILARQKAKQDNFTVVIIDI